MSFATGWTILPSLDNSGTTVAYAISTDGTRVVGSSVDGTGKTNAVYWTSSGITALPFLPGTTYAEAFSTNSDGTVIVGVIGDTSIINKRPFRWTSGGGMAELPVADGAAYGCSADGSAVVGITISGADPFLWTVGGGVIFSTGPGLASGAIGISPNGLLVAIADFDVNTYWKWTVGTGWVDTTVSLTDLQIPGGVLVSNNGTLMETGYEDVGPLRNAILQQIAPTPTTTTITIGAPGESTSYADTASPDGTFVVGHYVSDDASTSTAWYWTGSGTPTVIADPPAPYSFPQPASGTRLGLASSNTAFVGYVQDAGAVLHASIYVFSAAPAPPPADVYSTTKSLGGWRGLVGINWLGMALVGDAYSGVVGLSNFDVFREYQNPMIMRMTSPPIQNDRKRVFIRRFEIDVQAATADATTPDPQLVLEFSKDSGMTWEPLALARSMGEVGEYTKRLRWLNLGSSRSWVLRITIADPVRRAIIGAYLEVAAGLG